jgi:hypothetical protein
MTLLTVALIQIALLEATVASGPPDPRTTPRAWKVEGLPESKTVGPDPITLRVAADGELTQVLTAVVGESGKGTVRLTLGGLALANPKVGVKVYINVPADGPLPPADSDHYVGLIGASESRDKGDYAVDLAPALRKLAAKKAWAPGDPITIRLVAAPVKPRQRVAEPKATLERVTVEAPPVKE